MLTAKSRGLPRKRSSVRKRLIRGIVLRWLAAAVVIGLLPAQAHILAEEPRAVGSAAAGKAEASKSGTGTIMGKVIYQKDPRRPWRLGRYYIKNAKTGALAEAVVALSKRGLNDQMSARKPDAVIVDQKNFQFTPETVAIRAGDRIRFLNSDNQTHNVQTFHTRQSFNMNMPPGGEYIVTFPSASGIRQPYRIGCVYHSAMRAWVFVFDHPWFQMTGNDGAFRLTNVPPGEYQLAVAHPAGELRSSRTIAVKADQTVSLELLLSPDDLLGAKRKRSSEK